MERGAKEMKSVTHNLKRIENLTHGLIAGKKSRGYVLVWELDAQESEVFVIATILPKDFILLK